jgi:sialate O-acetylesterase
MIEASFGGSKIQPWMSADSLKGVPAAMVSPFQRNNVPPLPPSSLFNGMINGITRYTISGIIWYQGESNVHEAEIYRNLFQIMIADWRRRWDSASLPFLFVQLPNYNNAGKAKGEWCQLRDAQTSALKLKNTAMVVAIDSGDGHVHPPNKQPIGIRLALAALNIAYHEPVDYEGPILESVTRVKTVLVCKFAHTLNQLKVSQGGLLSGFEICGPDQHFFPASAQIKGDMVIVASKLVPDPFAVRYDWSDNPSGNLVNAQLFPTRPFTATPVETKDAGSTKSRLR